MQLYSPTASPACASTSPTRTSSPRCAARASPWPSTSATIPRLRPRRRRVLGPGQRADLLPGRGHPVQAGEWTELAIRRRMVEEVAVGWRRWGSPSLLTKTPGDSTAERRLGTNCVCVAGWELDCNERTMEQMNYVWLHCRSKHGELIYTHKQRCDRQGCTGMLLEDD